MIMNKFTCSLCLTAHPLDDLYFFQTNNTLVLCLTCSGSLGCTIDDDGLVWEHQVNERGVCGWHPVGKIGV